LKEGLSDDKLKVHMASKIEEAEFILEKHPISACIVDLFINNINAINYVKKWSALYPYIHFLIITAQDTSTNIIESIKAGAADIFPKPFDIKEIKGKILDLICTDKGRINSVEDVIKYDFQSKNKKMVDIYKLIGRIAKSDISILIEGDTGTGKEVIARMIHDKSDRKESPFIAINMAAVPKELLESELFGYEKGAFTGASSLKIGRFEEADGGTILLDEISELDYSLQSKLLRLIQEGDNNNWFK
jgi:DNA-binding NtrC family response regulator